MYIQYKPKYEMDEVIHVTSAQLRHEIKDIHIWQHLEVKQIPDDAMVRIKIGPKVYSVKLCEILLEDSSFIDFEAGNNKNFICVRCDKETFQPCIGHPRTDKAFPLFLDDDRVCQECFLKNVKLTPTTFEQLNEG
jgi:hypothetical protein